MKNKHESLFFLGLFAVVSVLLLLVFAPFLSILSLAVVFAVFLYPVYERLARILWGAKNFAAMITIVLVLVFFITPLFFLGFEIFKEAQGLYAHTQGTDGAYIHTIQTVIENPIRRVLPAFSIDLGVYVENILAFISNNLASLVSQTLYITLETFLMFLAFFFLLRDGRDMVASVTRRSPLGRARTDEILSKMYQTIQSIVKGTLFVGLVRWVIVGVTFYVCGIPNAILWGSIGGVVGVIPGLGTPFVFIPAVAYLYIEGNVLGAIALAIFGVAAIILLDNILTPYFFGKGLQVSSLFVLFSILGGIIFFGPVGFILGPLVLSVFLSIIHMYSLIQTKESSISDI